MVEAIGSAKANAHDLTSVTVTQALAQAKSGNIRFVDIQIQVSFHSSTAILLNGCEHKFIGASGLPKMDVVRTADPYFVAKIDDRISFVCVMISSSARLRDRIVLFQIDSEISNAGARVERAVEKQECSSNR
jgi:hypothetical protein